MSDNTINKSNFVNRLIHEKSPYLQQHAHNPVEWFPWGDEAFEKAIREDKPILLSIGYSACHWCHVMAHESFENDSVASLMNDFFINIKVDREEYPDVDHLYQTFVQMTSGQGGWPLTVFLTPDQIPFYGGTYFPVEARYGMVSFPDLLRRIHDIYESDRGRVQQSTAEIIRLLHQINQIESGNSFPDANKVFDNLYRSIINSFDTKNGGFSKAPKFPHVSDMGFLLRYYHYTGADEAKNMVLLTLRKMAHGGIFDQAGGGFHRYSTDESWLVPHFEKMLYDNALLIPLYADAYRLTKDNFFLEIAQRTADFVLTELTDPSGGFYSTLDADSEGEEGKYYVWDYQELWALLSEDIQDLFCEYYGITPGGNFEGKNILHVSRPLDSLLPNYQLDKKTADEKIEDAIAVLYTARQKRERPHLDNKILLDWNGMMISALWQLHQVTEEERYFEAAQKCLHFLMKNYTQADGSVIHFLKDKTKSVPGYLDDYAYLIKALLDGFETFQSEEYLKMAIKIIDYSLEHFWDHDQSGFYFTEDKKESRLGRIRQNYDGSTPVGNSIMCLNLQRIGAYTGMKKYQKAAEKMFKLHKDDLEKRPAAFSSLITALLFYHYSPVEITLSVPKQKTKSDFASHIFGMFIPERLFIRTDRLENSPNINQDLIIGRKSDDREAVFICYKNTCSLPINRKTDLPKVFKEFGLFCD
jgi:uncharacterized protein YyaL (SSP411 family)